MPKKKPFFPLFPHVLRRVLVAPIGKGTWWKTKKDPELGTTPSSEAAKFETSNTHDDPKLSSIQPDPIEKPDAVDDTPSSRFCSSSTADELDDVDNTSFGRNWMSTTINKSDAVDDTPSDRFCSSSIVNEPNDVDGTSWERNGSERGNDREMKGKKKENIIVQWIKRE